MDRIASALTRWCSRWVPDGYVIAGVLTIFVYAITLIATPSGPLTVIKHWGDGFWGFIPFTLQMAMVVLTGYVVADAPPVRRGLEWLAARPSTPRGAVALTAFVAMSLALLNWGVSLVGSALLAKKIAQRPIKADFRLLVASAYLGLGCMWHAGLSASAPLASSDPTQGFVKSYLGGPVPITETVFSRFNLLLALVVLIVMPLVAAAMHPPAGKEVLRGAPPEDEDDEQVYFAGPTTPAEWLERTPWVNLFLGAAVFAYLAIYLAAEGVARININHVNLCFFGLGALLHHTPVSLLRSAERGGRYVWGVLLQFGLYAGVAGVLDKSGLATQIAGLFTQVASPRSFPLLVVWYSGILNYLVPSGGAKWFIEVQYLADAARTIGVPIGKTIVAYAWGDMLTDIIQPFWAIPLLAVARLGFRDIMGYCLIFFLIYAGVVSAAFLAYGFAS